MEGDAKVRISHRHSDDATDQLTTISSRRKDRGFVEQG